MHLDVIHGNKDATIFELVKPHETKLSLPVDVFRKIFMLLTVSDAVRLGRVSTLLLHIVNEEKIWEIFYQRLNLGICELKEPTVKWKEFYKKNTDYERYTDDTLYIDFVATNVFGTLNTTKSGSVKIALASQVATGRHLKQIIRKTADLCEHIGFMGIFKLDGYKININDDDLLNQFKLTSHSTVFVEFKDYCSGCKVMRPSFQSGF